MNDQKKLKLSKETLRCLDDDALTDVVGGHHRHGGGGNVSGYCNASNGCISDQGECVSVGVIAVCLNF